MSESQCAFGICSALMAGCVLCGDMTSSVAGDGACLLQEILDCGSQMEQEMLEAAKRLKLKPAQAFEALSTEAYLDWHFVSH